jgi:fibronectin-binding autotransporter adhesin
MLFKQAVWKIIPFCRCLCLKEIVPFSRSWRLPQSASAKRMDAFVFNICRLTGLWGFLAAAILVLNFPSAKAADRYWNVASGNWSTAANWGGIEPTSSDSAYISNGGTAIVTDSGEICNSLYLGESGAGKEGTVEMTGGSLSTSRALIGFTGDGTFNQSAGTNTVTNILFLGANAGVNGTYNLSGTGQFSANREFIGFNPDATALFQQSGGTNTATYISLATNGQYKFSGGVLQINGGLDNQGILDFDDGSAVLNAANSIVNLGQPGSVLNNTQQATLNIGANSLLIVPSGFDPYTDLAHYSNSGILHTAGTVLTVSSGETVSGWGIINDPVICQGTIIAGTGGFIHLNNGLIISDTGNVNLGSGNLQIEDTTSAISGGTLSVYNLYVGYNGTGVFTQSAGVNTVNGLYIASNSGADGTYNFTGGTLILKSFGNGSGTGAFNFGGGTLQAGDNFTATQPMMLTGDGGNAKIDTAGYSVTLSGLLSGTGGLNKLGLGTLTLTQDASYSGDTHVEEGTLDVLNINTPTAAVSVAPGANELTAVSIASNSLTIGAGAKVVIKPIAAGPLSGAISAVPEPSAIVLLTLAFILLSLKVLTRSRSIGG